MAEQRCSVLLALRSVATATVLWVALAVPVAAAIVALRMSIWVLVSGREMATVAFLLGPLHGFWFYVAAPRAASGYNHLLLFRSLSGAFLGALAFPPVLSSTSVIAAQTTAVFLLTAGIIGGAAAGLVTAHVLHLSLLGRSMSLGLRVAISFSW
jgi:hypothetical protein